MKKPDFSLQNAFKVSTTNEALFYDFLKDLLTQKEYKEIIRRWEIVKALDKGVHQRAIAERLHIGIATVTRGSRELQKKNSGFVQVLKKLKGK